MASPSSRDMHISEPLPVTILSGFLGSGKTTLLKQILKNTVGLRIAVVVNDMAEINIDGAQIKRVGAAGTGEGTVVEMQNGCICCSLREDLLLTVTELALSRKFDYLVIEATGISEPQGVAETFALEATISDGKKFERPLNEIARLDTMVTLVDAVNFPSDLNSTDTAVQRWGTEKGVSQEDEEATKHIPELLIDQIEFADVIILNKVDLVDKIKVKELTGMVKALNPCAHTMAMSLISQNIAMADIIDTNLFSMEKASEAPGWLKALEGEIVSESEQYGISSVVYRRRKPFHPGRFLEAIEALADDTTILRSKGSVWIASRDADVVAWDLTGSIWGLERGEKWFIYRPEEDWTGDDADPEFVKQIRADFDPDVGDRRQELVIIGVNLDETRATTMLDNALLNDAEYHGGPEAWSRIDDPLDKWPESDISESGSEGDHVHEENEQANLGTDDLQGAEIEARMCVRDRTHEHGLECSAEKKARTK